MAIVLALTVACHKAPSGPDGVYTLCKEAAEFAQETVELREGRFRYWLKSPGSSDPLIYPLEGPCRISGQTLTLDHPEIVYPDRRLGTLNGVTVLWREDGLSLWETKAKIHPLAVLIRVDGAVDGPVHEDKRPSFNQLKTADMRSRDLKEREEGAAEEAPEIREIRRSRERYGDQQFGEYEKVIERARLGPDPKLVADLVARLGQDPPVRDRGPVDLPCQTSPSPRYLLEGIYGGPFWIVQGPPKFLQDGATRKKGLEALIEALPRARNRRALEDTLILFLRASGVGKMELAVPEARVTLRLEARANGYSCDSEGDPDDDAQWTKAFPKLIPPCQAWMRARLGE